ncbi:MAG TPA: hypothetical protein VF244_10000, partial [Acidimicrobiales bacterium]
STVPAEGEQGVGQPTATSIPTPTSTPSPTTTPPTTIAAPVLPGTWSALPPSGATPRYGGARSWTGKELLVWGGGTGFTDMLCNGEPCPPSGVVDGVAFDPATNVWRAMAPSPLNVVGAGGAWTGSEMVVWGNGRTSGAPAAAAAYDPAHNSWRTLPAGPVQGYGAELVAVGSEVYLITTGGTSPLAAALDPATGTWRVLPDPPANEGFLASAVVGGEVVVAMRNPGGGVLVAALSSGGQWRVVRGFAGPASSHSSAAVVDGSVWLSTCHSPQGVPVITIRSVDVATGAFVERPAPAPGCPDLIAAGSRLLLLAPVPWDAYPTSYQAFEPTATGWRELSPLPAGTLGDPLWTGAEVLFWGGCRCGDFAGAAVEGGFRFRW